MKTFKKVGKIVLIVVVVLAAVLGGLLVYLTVTEYRPESVETLELPSGTRTVAAGDEVSVVSFNTGYAGLGKDADFFMDGGTQVNPKSRELVEQNLSGIAKILSSLPADAYLLQEVDLDSGRTYRIDEATFYERELGLPGTFAYNYNCNFVPYPLPMIGRVKSGLLTLSDLQVREAQRISLPVPFSWPVRTCNLKRCLLVERIPLAESDAELVLVNLHLEAYDEGEGKKAQTEMLSQFLAEEYAKGNYIIAGGDFNQTFPGVKSYPLVDTENWAPGVIAEDVLPEGFSFAVDDSLPTCRLLSAPYTGSYESSQMYVIDGFIVSPNVSVESVDVQEVAFTFSDHQPVLLKAVLEG